MKGTLVVVGIIGLIIFLRGGMESLPEGNPKFQSPIRTDQPEYDCRKHAPDKVCEVPWKDKVVLYCYADSIPRVVRFREECV